MSLLLLFRDSPAGGGAVSYTLSGDVGSYAFAGRAATFKAGRQLSGSAGAYSQAGNTAAFKAARVLTGAPGVYSYSGSAGLFKAAHTLLGASGAYALTGNAATFRVGRALSGSAGAYVFSGRQGTFSQATSAAYALSGAAGLYSISGKEAVFALSGQAKAAGGYDKPKRRFVVKVGDRLVEYRTASAAMRAAQAGQEKQTEKSPDVVAEVPIRAIKAQARVFKAEQKVQNLFKQQDFDTMLALYRQMMDDQDEEDIEMLLMSL